MGVALAFVIVAGAASYRAFDVPTVRAVIAATLARANAIAPLIASPGATSPIERADNAGLPSPSTASRTSSPALAAPGFETVTAPSPPAGASSDASANEATPVPDAQTMQATPGMSTKGRTADTRRGSNARTHPQPSRHSADRDALETQRLIERDLGRFLAK